jgi:DNA-directed RNA polymerase alpha subunit
MYRRPSADRDDQIVEAVKCGMMQRDIAKQHGLSSSYVSAIWRRHLESLENTPVQRWVRLGLSSRAAHCLVNEGIYTIGDLRGYDLLKLARAPNVGAVTMAEYFMLLTGHDADPS